MDYRKEYEKWLASPALSEDERTELKALEGNDKEIKARFYGPLEFGTAGLRGTMYTGLHIGRNQMLAERRIIGIFDLEITSQSKTTRAFLDRAQQEGTVLEVCDDLPKSFLVCDHPYHPQIVYLSELSSQTLQKRMEEST